MEIILHALGLCGESHWNLFHALIVSSRDCFLYIKELQFTILTHANYFNKSKT